MRPQAGSGPGPERGAGRKLSVMSTFSPPTRVSVGSPVDVALVVPHLLGFVPSESLVVVAVSGARRRLGLSLRIDLPPSGVEEQVVGSLVHDLRRSGAEEILVAVMSDRPRRGSRLPHADLVDRLADQGLPIVEAVLVRDGRCWSYLCRNRRCCPAEGRPLAGDGADRIAAAFVGIGSRVLGSRDALLDSVRPVSGPEADAARRALAAAERVNRRMAAVDAATWLEEFLDRRIDGAPDPRSAVPSDEAARFAMLLQSVPLRDETIGRWVGDVAGPGENFPDETRWERQSCWRRLLLEVARVTLPPHDAPICTLFALAAYDAGDGVLVGAALDRALETDPTYGLALLLEAALDAQVHPGELVRVLAASANGPVV